MALSKRLDFIKPNSKLSKGVYHTLNFFVPIIVLVLVLTGFVWAAVLAVLLAKWRMFAMKPRYWLPNLRANSVDIFVGLSVVVFLAGTNTFVVQLAWTLFYIFWVVWLKPRSDQVSVTVQALIAQGITIVAYYQAYPKHPLWVGVLVAFIVCYLSVRHFLGAFDEKNYRQISAVWAWFGASMTWVLEHWLIEYLSIPQVSLIITLVGYSLAFMYYMHANGKLKKSLKNQLIFVMIVFVIVLLVLSDWKDKTV